MEDRPYLSLAYSRRFSGDEEVLLSLIEDSSILSTCLMSVKNHDSVSIDSPAAAHPIKKLDIPVRAAIAPEAIIPKGCAAEDSAISTEFTLPCSFTGTTVCIIVIYDTLIMGRPKAMISALKAINQKRPVGVSAKRM